MIIEALITRIPPEASVAVLLEIIAFPPTKQSHISATPAPAHWAKLPVIHPLVAG